MRDSDAETDAVPFSGKRKGFGKGCPIRQRPPEYQVLGISRQHREPSSRGDPLHGIRQCIITERDVFAAQIQDEGQLSIGSGGDHFRQRTVWVERHWILFESETFDTAAYRSKNSNIGVCFNCDVPFNGSRGCC